MSESTQTNDSAATATGFDDLLSANRAFAEDFALSGFDGVAQRGVAIVTCMDSRIDPLGMLGLSPGDAKIFRNPGGRIDNLALEALVLATHLLNVKRVLVVPHTRCAVASSSAAELRQQVSDKAGKDATWMGFHVIEDQQRALREDVAKVRSHPLMAEGTLVAGFIYDVDSGLLQPVE
jgi:carbonic anhydrase